MKKILVAVLSIMLCGSFAYANELDDLKKQITKMEKKVKSLSKTVNKNTKHVATDRVSLGVEFRTDWHAYKYNDALQMPEMAQDMFGYWLNDSLSNEAGGTATPGDFAWDAEAMTNVGPNDTVTDGWNDQFMRDHAAELQGLMGGMMGTMSGTDMMTMMSGMYDYPNTFSTDMPVMADSMMDAMDTDYLGTAFLGMMPTMTADQMAIMGASMGASGAFADPMNPTPAEMGAFMQGMNAAEVTGMFTAMGFSEAQMGGMMEAFVMDAGGSGVAMNEMMGMMASMFSDRTLTAAQAGVMKQMFKNMDPVKYDSTNSSIFTNRLRIKMKAKVNSHLSFTGRLVMYKTWGDSSNVNWFDGTFNSMHLDGNSGAIPTDDAVRVDRAYFVYGNSISDVDWHLSFGRRPSTNGFGMDNKNNGPLGGSPAGHIIQWNFDGASLGFGLEELTGVPGLNFKICYGVGFEGGYGTLNSMMSDEQVNDVNMWGVVFKLFDNEDYKLVYNWAHGYGVTDGFVGQVAMPFYISGNDYNNDGEFDEFTFNPNFGGYMSRFEPTAEIGDVDMHSLIAQGNTFDWSWFVSGATSISKPKGGSKNAMFQFMEMDGMLCGGDAECKDRTGYSVWAGIMTPEIPYLGGKFGVEYNWGSQYWFNFTQAEDAITGTKLGTRGSVYEAYYHQPIVGNRFFATVGYKYYDYDYTGSGSPLGAPVKIDEANAFNTMMPVKDIVQDLYVTGTFRY